jgi:hypothetical protein
VVVGVEAGVGAVTDGAAASIAPAFMAAAGVSTVVVVVSTAAVDIASAPRHLGLIHPA